MTRTEGVPSARRSTTSALLGCALGVALVALALGVTLLLQNVVSTAGYLFFYAAVVASAWFGGKWSGGLAVALSMLTVAYFFTPPIRSFLIGRESLPVFVEFAASAAVVSWFSSWRRHAETALARARDELQMRVDERTAELRHSNARLLAEIAERRRAQDAYNEAQAELARVTRISALGALAASISHEVNQPLAAVVTNADACMIWLSSDPPNLEEARTAVDCIAQQGTRASDIVRRIRAMFTKAAPERTTLQINELIREVMALVEAEAARNQVAVQAELAPGLPASMGDRIQIQQVMMNLILNAMEAMSEVEDRPREIVIRSEKSASDKVLVAVRDSGIGIDTTDPRRLFDAFFTTKPQGMGMGLSISHSIIEAHGGRLWAAANAGPGATFQFTLPAGPETAS
jgi:C4-dicarboxylate-specific signal transduction histidine kinase